MQRGFYHGLLGVGSALVLAVCLLVALLAWPSAAAAQSADATEVEQQGEPPTTRQEILQRQREEKRTQLTPYRVSDAEARVSRLETFRLPRRIFAKGFGGFRPVVGGMPSGSGFVFGGGYIAGYNHELIQFTANARYSTRGYRSVDTGIIFPTPASQLPVQAHVKAEVRDLTSLRFFGLGPQSSASGRSTYGLEDQSLEAGVTATATRFVELGAVARWTNAEVGPGTSGASLEERFDPLLTPGFGTTTDYLVYGGHLTLQLRDAHVSPSAGVSIGVEASRYDDRGSGLYDFTRLVGDVQTQIPLGYRNRILALRVRSSNSVGENGGAVPFYLMETIGGANSIRGFREYRFRGGRNLVVNAEYRWEIWTYVDFALFYDAGKVFSDADELNFQDM
ncbi:MAG: BamA/TamA family outer membrane protein [Vicinamibacterales bacterium]|nr:BamA/TamA family outer membrane protein [Vicinamibacterales bacterium]